MKQVLITGGTGFLGRRTAAHFKDLGFRVLTPSHGELDITEEASVQKWFREHKPEGVIHTAAISDSYTSKAACENGIESVRKNAPVAEISE